MKRSVRPLFSMCLFIAIAATLVFRIVLRVGPTFSDEVLSKPAAVAAPVFNATLLRYAAIDLGEAKMKQDIEDLVEGNFKGAAQGRQRSFLSSGKYRIDIRAKSARGMPVQLRSPEFYRLWLQFRRHLQDWSRKRRFQPNVMSDLVSTLKPFSDHNDNVLGLGKKYKTCAVVGNSGILLKSKLGEAIDNHEFVIRLNNARTTSYEIDVGKKTSISFINSNILHFCARRDGCYCHPYGQNVPIVMYICQPVHFLDYTLCNSSHKAPLVITDPGFDMLCTRIAKYYSLKRFLEETGKSVEEWVELHDGNNFHYSSGMQAVMLALGICDNVSIFGFGKSNSTKHHYHTNQKAELRLHDYAAEYDLYRDMVAKPQKPITFCQSIEKLQPLLSKQLSSRFLSLVDTQFCYFSTQIIVSCLINLFVLQIS